MPWDARKISDRQYHSRRLVFACFGAVAALAIIAGSMIPSDGRFSVNDLLMALFGLLMLARCIHDAIHENRAAKAKPEKPE